MDGDGYLLSPEEVMKIKWYGHAAFLLLYSDGTRIITDPYIPGCFDNSLRYYPITDESDFVFISHHHPDHDGARCLKGNPRTVDKPGSHVAGSVEVTGIPTFHDTEKGRLRGSNTIYLFCAEGLRVAHLGDLGHLPEEQATSLKPVDVLLLPVGGFYTIDPATASQTASLLQARLIIPMHYKTDRLDFPIADLEEFSRLFSDIRRVDTDTVEVNADLLPAKPQVWVLKYSGQQ